MLNLYIIFLLILIFYFFYDQLDQIKIENSEIKEMLKLQKELASNNTSLFIISFVFIICLLIGGCIYYWLETGDFDNFTAINDAAKDHTSTIVNTSNKEELIARAAMEESVKNINSTVVETSKINTNYINKEVVTKLDEILMRLPEHTSDSQIVEQNLDDIEWK